MAAAKPPDSTSAQPDERPLVLLKRPFLLIAAFLVPGIVLGHEIFPKEQMVWLHLALFASLAVAVLLFIFHSTFSTPAAMLVVFFVGVQSGARIDVLPSRHVHFRLKPDVAYQVRGIVVEEPVPTRPGGRQQGKGAQRDNRCRFVVKALQSRGAESDRVAWTTVKGKVLVYASGEEARNLRYGDKVELSGRVFLPETRRNPGGFDFRKYLAESGIYVCMRAEDIRSVEPGHGNPIFAFIHSLKNRLRDSLSAGSMGRDEEAFLRAIVLGERREIGDEFKEALRKTNTMHILAISGLNVAILAWVIYSLFTRLFLVPQTISSLVTIVLLFPYAVLTGMAPPVVRACLMCGAFLLAPLLKKRSDAINGLAFAAAVILLFRPGDLFTASFQLSFMVVLAILLLGDRIFYWCVWLFRLRPDPGYATVGPQRRWAYRRLAEPPLRLFSVSVAAFIGSLPLTVHYFHHISLLSWLWNIPVVLLVGWILPLGSLAAILGLLTQPVAGFLNTANGYLSCLVRAMVTSFSSVKLGSFNVSPPPLPFAFAFYSLIFAVGFSRSLRRAIVLKVTLTVLVAGSFIGGELARRHPDSLDVTFLDVGQGDCIFVEYPDGRRVLVDGGSSTRNDVGRYVIVPFLRWAGVNRLDAIVISHYDVDHINGLKSVLDEIKTRRIVVRANADPSKNSDGEELLDAADEKRIARVGVHAGDDLLLSTRVAAEILNPPVTADSVSTSENDLSIVVRLTFRGASALLCGDIEEIAERLILRRETPLRSSVLKVPHHGSSSSSSDEFLRAVAPRIAVISCGRGNVYRHPSPEVLERCENQGIRVLRTDLNGGIVVRVFRGKLTVTATL